MPCSYFELHFCKYNFVDSKATQFTFITQNLNKLHFRMENKVGLNVRDYGLNINH
jgi:hypothetical protein